MNPKPYKFSNGRPRSFTEDEMDETVEQFIAYRHKRENIRKDHGSVWVAIPFTNTMLQVRKNEIVFHGEWDNDAIAAALRHAQEAWSGRINVSGSEDFKMRVWAHSVIAGVEIGNYHPPAHRLEEARNLIGATSVDNFNRHHLGRDDGTLGSTVDKRHWGYKNREPTPAERRYRESVERAMGLNPRSDPYTL